MNGFIYEGNTSGNDNFKTIDYPNGTFTYVHSTMGGLAVGNSDGPGKNGAPLGPGQAFSYDVENGTIIGNIVYPGSLSNTAYVDFVTHFEGISSVEKGVYTLSADSVQKSKDPGPAQGSFVVVRRNGLGGFGRARWIDLHVPKTGGISSSNSIFGNQVVLSAARGITIGGATTAQGNTIVDNGAFGVFAAWRLHWVRCVKKHDYRQWHRRRLGRWRARAHLYSVSVKPGVDAVLSRDGSAAL